MSSGEGKRAALIRDIPIRFFLVGGFLLAGVLPVVVTALLSLESGKEALRDRALQQLQSVLSLKKAQLQRFFLERTTDARTLASDPYVREAAVALCTAFQSQGGSRQGRFLGENGRRYRAPAPYREVHDKYEPFLRKYIDSHGYYDVFLMDAQANEICFTVEKESDFGVRVSQWPTSLREVSQAVSEGAAVALSDTKLYAPSANAAAQFVSAPIVDEQGSRVGIVALQVGLEGISRIVGERAGMGQTGDTYLVGADYRMRSDTYLDPTNHAVEVSLAGSVQENGITTEAVKEALAGNQGSLRARNYQGRMALTVYAPLAVGASTWALVAEIDDSEIEQEIGQALDRQVLLVLGLSVVAVVTLGLLFSAFIGRAIGRLTGDVETLGSRVLAGELTLKGDTQDVSTDFRGVVGQLNGVLESFVALLDFVPTPLVLVDRNCLVRFANNAFCHLAGRKREELLCQHYTDLCSQAGLQRTTESPQPLGEADVPVCRALSSNAVSRAETVWKRPDASGPSHFLSTAAPLTGPDGAVVGAIEVLVDQTEAWEAARDKEALEEHVNRIHRLESLGTLAGGIAHDFNNILTYLFAYCDIARSMLPDQSPAAEPLGHLSDGVERASNLVQRILAFSRQAQAPAGIVDLSKVVHETLEIARPSMPKSVFLQETVEASCEVVADPSQLQQVVLNLFTNAWQAMPQGGTLTVSVLRAHEPGSPMNGGKKWVALRVSDTGVGIPPELHQRIFEPFYSGKAPGQGTGLGLSVVHGIVGRLGGRVELSSAPGEGSVFTVYLPAAEGFSLAH